MVKKFYVIFIIVLYVVISFSAVQWKKSFYAEFNYKKFKNYVYANLPIKEESIDSRLMSAALFYSVNKHRVKNNVKPLKYSEPLREAAYSHSYFMVHKNFLSTTSPISGMRTLKDRVLKFTRYRGILAETLAMEFAIKYSFGQKYIKGENKVFYYENGKRIPMHTYNSFAEKVVKQWINSGKHKKVLLCKKFKYSGAGAWFYYGNDGMLMAKVTQLFAERVYN